ncbi:hypothetical protein CDL15_Pgr026149 [Punica granatum]|uniref:Uncharacterized protein n=1 Tax=Punica granatum TaxID=22663 RepID=A0A218WCS1_PUNGR|nr:hypothetical protein CDL15_Pgr026149 [Punica granatum]
MVNRVETHIDKVVQFRGILTNTGGDKKNLAFYIGCDVGDLLCLLEADIGIVIFCRPDLKKIGLRFGISFVPLFEGLVKIQKQLKDGSCPFSNGKTGVLYTVSSWVEIQAFFLGRVKATNVQVNVPFLHRFKFMEFNLFFECTISLQFENYIYLPQPKILGTMLLTVIDLIGAGWSSGGPSKVPVEGKGFSIMSGGDGCEGSAAANSKSLMFVFWFFGNKEGMDVKDVLHMSGGDGENSCPQTLIYTIRSRHHSSFVRQFLFKCNVPRKLLR